MPALLDGREVPADSPEWRDLCLARYVLALPEKSQRTDFLEDLRRLHGEKGCQSIETLVIALFRGKNTGSRSQ
jgi:hypothetical protein